MRLIRYNNLTILHLESPALKNLTAGHCAERGQGHFRTEAGKHTTFQADFTVFKQNESERTILIRNGLDHEM